MPRFYQLLNVFRSNDLTQKRILVGIFLLWVIWYAGYFDFLRETDFKQFAWPPYVDVRREVVREMTDNSSEFLYYNKWTDFQHLAQPTCKKNWLTRKRSILIIVKSAPDRIERRQAYRKTLSTVKQLSGYRIRTVFVMGKRNNEQFAESSLQIEAVTYNDMLVGDFVDHYFNNTLKYMHSLKLARWHCFPNSSVVPFLVLLDDDYMISLNNLISLLDKHQPNEQLFMGSRMESTPFRLANRKFWVSIDEYPFDAFPPYISGGCVLYSPQAIKEFYLAAQHLKLFRFDDVFAGIIAYYLGYDTQLNKNFLFNRNDGISWDIKIAEHQYSVEEIYNSFSITNFTLIK